MNNIHKVIMIFMRKFKKNRVIIFLYSNLLRFLTIFSPKLNTKISFRISKGYWPSFKNPISFDEKVSWLKLFKYKNNKLVSQCADKIKVREYVKDLELESILNEKYIEFNKVNEIEISKLPQSFAMKWNIGSGGNFFVNNKDLITEKQIKQFMQRKKNRYGYLTYSEMHYRKIKPKIIVEKLLNDEGGLDDYKVYCFNGVARYVMVCVGRENGNPKYYFFNQKWELQRINKDGINAEPMFNIPKPKGIEKVFKAAETLSKPFPFVRADFYLIKGEVIFGELTFTPSAAQDSNILDSMDKYFGDLIEIKI